MPLVALVTKIGGWLPARMLEADGGATTLLADLAIKFGGGLPSGMLLANGGADYAFGGSGDQVWWRFPVGMLAADISYLNSQVKLAQPRRLKEKF